jgi:hypothetical protein
MPRVRTSPTTQAAARAGKTSAAATVHDHHVSDATNLTLSGRW